MSETVETTGSEGVSASTFMTWEDKVDAAYKRCEKDAASVVRSDYMFRGARKELARSCATFFITAFGSEHLIDSSLRADVDTPEEVADILQKHGIQPPAHWSLNPCLGLWNHFYLQARVAVTERGTASGREYPLTQEEADDEMEIASDQDRNKPLITVTVAEGREDQTENSKWAMASRYGRWVLAAVDMEDMTVFDVSWKEWDTRYKTWLKKEPFPDFQTQPVPDGMRKPSIARQETKAKATRGSRAPRTPSSGTKAYTSASTVTPSATVSTPPPNVEADKATDEMLALTGLPKRLSPEDYIMSKAAIQAAEAAEAALEDSKAEPEPEPEPEAVQEPLEAKAPEAPEPVTETVTEPDAAKPPLEEGDPAEEPEEPLEEEVNPQPEPVEEGDPDEEPEAPEAKAPEPEPTPEPTEAKSETVAEPEVKSESTAAETPEEVPLAAEVVDRVHEVQRMLSYSEFIVMSPDTMDELPEQGSLTYRKTADGRLEITGYLIYQPMLRAEAI